MQQPRPPHAPAKLWGTLAPAYAHRLLTEREFAQLPNDDFYRYELVDGRVIQMPPPQDEHSNVQANLIMLLKIWQKENKVGGRVRAELGVLLSEKGEPRLVLGPDAAYIAPGRKGERKEAYERIAPDFVAEIASPSQTRPEMYQKVNLYLAAGVKLLWLIWPNPQFVEVWQADDTTQARAKRGEIIQSKVLTSADTLTGFAVLPAFSCPVSDIFEDIAVAETPDAATDPSTTIEQEDGD